MASNKGDAAKDLLVEAVEVSTGLDSIQILLKKHLSTCDVRNIL